MKLCLQWLALCRAGLISGLISDSLICIGLIGGSLIGVGLIGVGLIG